MHGPGYEGYPFYEVRKRFSHCLELQDAFDTKGEWVQIKQEVLAELEKSEASSALLEERAAMMSPALWAEAARLFKEKDGPRSDSDDYYEHVKKDLRLQFGDALVDKKKLKALARNGGESDEGVQAVLPKQEWQPPKGLSKWGSADTKERQRDINFLLQCATRMAHR
jgi:hypothetical protein